MHDKIIFGLNYAAISCFEKCGSVSRRLSKRLTLFGDRELVPIEKKHQGILLVDTNTSPVLTTPSDRITKDDVQNPLGLALSI